MHKILLLLTALFLFHTSEAQTTDIKSDKSSYAMPSRDYLMFQIGYENWSNVPDSIKIGGLGRALNTYLCYDFPIMKSNFSFAAGIGVGTSSVYLKGQQIVLTDTTAYIQFIPETVDYKKYKYTTAYIEAPFELRYFGNKENRNVGFKAAIGMRIGALVSAHTKSKRTLNSKPIVEKTSTKRYLETWRYAATVRLGYGNFSVYGAYSISNLFRVNSGPENVKPFQLGLCITGL
ncbi:MAG: outer membrane beta-barrel protein [Chitinophagaceae bacterium]|nr:outer membrane beta-barrel protein [Chitinophagaceae bacterium]